VISFTCDTSAARALIAPLKRLSQARLHLGSKAPSHADLGSIY
jgi:hypothetical protein